MQTIWWLFCILLPNFAATSVNDEESEFISKLRQEDQLRLKSSQNSCQSWLSPYGSYPDTSFLALMIKDAKILFFLRMYSHYEDFVFQSQKIRNELIAKLDENPGWLELEKMIRDFGQVEEEFELYSVALEMGLKFVLEDGDNAEDIYDFAIHQCQKRGNDFGILHSMFLIKNGMEVPGFNVKDTLNIFRAYYFGMFRHNVVSLQDKENFASMFEDIFDGDISENFTKWHQKALALFYLKNNFWISQKKISELVHKALSKPWFEDAKFHPQYFFKNAKELPKVDFLFNYESELHNEASHDHLMLFMRAVYNIYMSIIPLPDDKKRFTSEDIFKVLGVKNIPGILTQYENLSKNPALQTESSTLWDFLKLYSSARMMQESALIDPFVFIAGLGLLETIDSTFRDVPPLLYSQVYDDTYLAKYEKNFASI